MIIYMIAIWLIYDCYGQKARLVQVIVNMVSKDHFTKKSNVQT